MSLSDVEIRASLGEKVDEVCCDTDLSADVRELRGYAEKEHILLPHGLVDVPSCPSGHFSLISHIGVGDLGNRGWTFVSC
jgi:hypothetical protein